VAHGQALTPVAVPLALVTSEQLTWQSSWAASQKKVVDAQAQASESSVLAAPVDAVSTVQSILHLTSVFRPSGVAFASTGHIILVGDIICKADHRTIERTV
jgi:hypothetical protein